MKCYQYIIRYKYNNKVWINYINVEVADDKFRGDADVLFSRKMRRMFRLEGNAFLDEIFLQNPIDVILGAELSSENIIMNSLKRL
jgi:hypothetical protein